MSYEGPERRRSRGRRATDLPPWVTYTLALVGAVQPILLAIAALIVAVKR